ncbi:hypothetical protein CVPH_0497 [Abyssogena phaseoliformis symbiont OG214]|uniref:hypothetical protein n=1 Tax=Abyssogena phaseoliformis symbiont TaxID=596095 RepID=UPI001915547C|nr:hypothetical protein [Abyssogena phaseoliformis symbiont]MBW5288877.1 hypothetical protein [Candidatus Ruthia sp. Apha_13_S6]BBB22565.1 hypothetical protein CVPH_0497 [Abyssogena phaseoliformis symbiont OG214]
MSSKIESFIYKAHYIFNKIQGSLSGNNKTDLCDINNIVNEYTLLHKGLSLSSVISIKGIIDDELGNQLINSFADAMENHITSGVDIKICFSINNNSPEVLSKNIEKMKENNRTLDLGLGQSIDALDKKLKKHINNQKIFIIIYTHQNSIPKGQYKNYNKKPTNGSEYYGEQGINEQLHLISPIYLQKHTTNCEAFLESIGQHTSAEIIPALKAL